MKLDELFQVLTILDNLFCQLPIDDPMLCKQYSIDVIIMASVVLVAKHSFQEPGSLENIAKGMNISLETFLEIERDIFFKFAHSLSMNSILESFNFHFRQILGPSSEKTLFLLHRMCVTMLIELIISDFGFWELNLQIIHYSIIFISFDVLIKNSPSTNALGKKFKAKKEEIFRRKIKDGSIYNIKSEAETIGKYLSSFRATLYTPRLYNFLKTHFKQPKAKSSTEV